MAATINAPLPVRDPRVETFQAAIATTFFNGCFVGLVSATKLLRPLQAGDQFVGLHDDEDPYFLTDLTKGEKVIVGGAVEIPFAAAALTDINKPVYASDSNTVTFTTGSNSYIGYVRNVVPGVSLIVQLPDTKGILTSLTAATGTASDTIADVTGAFVQATLNNNFKSIADKLNAVIKLLRGY